MLKRANIEYRSKTSVSVKSVRWTQKLVQKVSPSKNILLTQNHGNWIAFVLINRLTKRDIVYHNVSLTFVFVFETKSTSERNQGQYEADTHLTHLNQFSANETATSKQRASVVDKPSQI